MCNCRWWNWGHCTTCSERGGEKIQHPKINYIVSTVRPQQAWKVYTKLLDRGYTVRHFSGLRVIFLVYIWTVCKSRHTDNHLVTLKPSWTALCSFNFDWDWGIGQHLCTSYSVSRPPLPLFHTVFYSTVVSQGPGRPWKGANVRLHPSVCSMLLGICDASIPRDESL